MSTNHLKKGSLAVALAALVTVYALARQPVQSFRKEFRKTNAVLYLPPVELLPAMALNFKNMVSMLMLIRANVYNGERLAAREKPDWHWFYKMMEASLALDPYNLDAYYVMQAMLPWEAGMVREANILLEKGLKKRTGDWQLPFFIAFNHFYFLKDNASAARYFSKAAKIEPRLAPLAGMYFQRANEAETGLRFLKYMLKQTKNEGIRKRILERIGSLENIVAMQKEVERFKSERGRLPASLEELVSEGFITEIPTDPWRMFFMSEDGRVRFEAGGKVR